MKPCRLRETALCIPVTLPRTWPLGFWTLFSLQNQHCWTTKGISKHQRPRKTTPREQGNSFWKSAPTLLPASFLDNACKLPIYHFITMAALPHININFSVCNTGKQDEGDAAYYPDSCALHRWLSCLDETQRGNARVANSGGVSKLGLFFLDVKRLVSYFCACTVQFW